MDGGRLTESGFSGFPSTVYPQPSTLLDNMDNIILQWTLLIGASLLIFFVSPRAKSKTDFFRGSKNDQAPGFWMLTSSLVISWLFAKSITNAANLGMNFGMVGGVAYAAYYLSFLVAGIIIYRMRTKGGFASIHHFLESKYGGAAVLIFSFLIGIRLLNEVWSNNLVIGSYFGESGSSPFYISILVFTGLTIAYTLKGGLRSSLLTDLIQMILFGILLFVILGMILPKEGENIGKFINSGEWSLSGGMDLLFVAVIQVFSYPFHDPVLTDRAFISDPKTTLRSFFWATLIGSLCIMLFSFVGIYASFENLEGQAPVEVSKLLGLGMMLAMNFIMVTSAASTLDSAFNSFSKLFVIDHGFFQEREVFFGRWVIVAMAILGTIPVFLGAEILSATTISGTMVLGLSPVFLFWQKDFPQISYYLSIGAGLCFGFLIATDLYPSSWVFFEGTYAKLLSANILGVTSCFVLFFLPVLFLKPKAYETIA